MTRCPCKGNLDSDEHRRMPCDDETELPGVRGADAWKARTSRTASKSAWAEGWGRIPPKTFKENMVLLTPNFSFYPSEL